VGLLGDIRQVIAQEKREKEAKRLGYKNIISNKNVKYLPQAIRKYIGK
jgi:predicted ATP-dependent serine protease